MTRKVPRYTERDKLIEQIKGFEEVVAIYEDLESSEGRIVFQTKTANRYGELGRLCSFIGPRCGWIESKSPGYAVRRPDKYKLLWQHPTPSATSDTGAPREALRQQQIQSRLEQRIGRSVLERIEALTVRAEAAERQHEAILATLEVLRGIRDEAEAG